MKKTNLDWSKIQLEYKKRTRKNLREKIIKTIVWKNCSFVWKNNGSRIVYYSGIILEDLWNKVKCEMKDNYIHSSDELFEIILLKKDIKINK